MQDASFMKIRVFRDDDEFMRFGVRPNFAVGRSLQSHHPDMRRAEKERSEIGGQSVRQILIK